MAQPTQPVGYLAVPKSGNGGFMVRRDLLTMKHGERKCVFQRERRTVDLNGGVAHISDQNEQDSLIY